MVAPLVAGAVVRQYRVEQQPTVREQALEQAGLAETERRVLLEERAVIARDLLTNVVRHAQAEAASVTVEHATTGLSVQVTDRGRGFDPAAPRPDRAGHGLAGMRERTRIHGGTLAVASAPGAGTAVSAWLPHG